LKVVSLNKRREIASFRKEVGILNRLSHANIIACNDSNEFSFQGNKYGVMEMEKLDMDLMDLIMSNKCIPEKVSRLVFKKVCSAVLHCHTQGIAHLDIKADNILVKLTEDGQVQDIKLCDFGFAINWCEFNHKTSFGTREYRPLECFTEEYSVEAEKVDIWSLGVLLFTLITGLYPFMIQEETNTIHSLGLSMLRDFSSDKNLEKLLGWIFSVDPADRPSISQIINHPWVTGTKEIVFGLSNEIETSFTPSDSKDIKKIQIKNNPKTYPNV